MQQKNDPKLTPSTTNPSAVNQDSPLLIGRKGLSIRWGGVSHDTIRRREKAGLLTPLRFGPNIVRYRLDEVERYEEEATA